MMQSATKWHPFSGQYGLESQAVTRWLKSHDWFSMTYVIPMWGTPIAEVLAA
jgi:hypothetical protein